MKRKLFLILVISMLVIPFYPWIHNSIENRQKTMATPIANLYTIDFPAEWKRLQEFIEISQDAKLENFDLGYNEDGSIRDFTFDLIGHRDQQMFHSTIRFVPERGEYTIRRMKIDSWIQYDRLVSAKSFFTLLDGLDLKKMKPATTFDSYVLKCTGEKRHYSIRDPFQYLIEGDQFVEVNASEQSINGYSLVSFGMKKTSETSAIGDGQRYYYFDETTSQ